MSSKAAGDQLAAKTARPSRPAPAQSTQPRLRVLAGPNGSGKSTIKSELKPQWIGVFVNADEIEKELKASGGHLALCHLGVTGRPSAVLKRIKTSLKPSVCSQRQDLPKLLAGTTLDEALPLQVSGPCDSYLALTLAEAARQELLEEGQTFTFETVASLRSKIVFMREGRARGCRGYLYFVATDDPAINIDRVRRRARQGGIRFRTTRSSPRC